MFPPAVSRLEAPPLNGNAAYSVAPEPVWVKETVPVAPANRYDMNDIYKYLYLAVRDRVPFPVTNAEGFRNTEMMQRLKEAHPDFNRAGDL